MKLATVEQISRWHPDKYADAISDYILYLVLREDNDAHCGIETMVKDTTVVVGGEIKTVLSSAELRRMIKEAIKRVSKNLGYKVTKIINLISQQSPEIDRAVTTNDGAGDQGIMVGYAYNRDGKHRPTGLAHKELADRIIDNLYKITGKDYPLNGDAKCQVTYDIDTGKIHTIVVSACHKKEYSLDTVRMIIGGAISQALLGFKLKMIADAKIIINPAGEWTIGGPIADSGITGRKLVCDAYGPQVPIGGGASAGKDYTKVDRTGFYMAKHLADVLLGRYNIDYVRVELAYIIGISTPASVSVYSNKTRLNASMVNYIMSNFDLSPHGMIKHLNLMDERRLYDLLVENPGYLAIRYINKGKGA